MAGYLPSTWRTTIDASNGRFEDDAVARKLYNKIPYDIQL